MKNISIVSILFFFSFGCGPMLASSPNDEVADGLNAVRNLTYEEGTMTRNRVPAGVPRGSRRFLQNGVMDHLITFVVVDDHPLVLVDLEKEVPMPWIKPNEIVGFKMPSCFYKDGQGWGCDHVIEGELVEIVDLPDPEGVLSEDITEQPDGAEESRKCFRKEVSLSPRHSAITKIAIMWYNILDECPDRQAPRGRAKTALASRR